jgi:hypothetical protein
MLNAEGKLKDNYSDLERVLRGGGVPIPFPPCNCGKVPAPVGFLLQIPVNKKTLFIGRINSFKTF